MRYADVGITHPRSPPPLPGRGSGHRAGKTSGSHWSCRPRRPAREPPRRDGRSQPSGVWPTRVPRPIRAGFSRPGPAPAEGRAGWCAQQSSLPSRRPGRHRRGAAGSDAGSTHTVGSHRHPERTAPAGRHWRPTRRARRTSGHRPAPHTAPPPGSSSSGGAHRGGPAGLAPSTAHSTRRCRTPDAHQQQQPGGQARVGSAMLIQRAWSLAGDQMASGTFMINLRVMPALQPHIPRRVATITAGHTSRPTTLPGPWVTTGRSWRCRAAGNLIRRRVRGWPCSRGLRVGGCRCAEQRVGDAAAVPGSDMLHSGGVPRPRSSARA